MGSKACVVMEDLSGWSEAFDVVSGDGPLLEAKATAATVTLLTHMLDVNFNRRFAIDQILASRYLTIAQRRSNLVRNKLIFYNL